MNKFERFVSQIFQTNEQEILCSECLDLVSDYVDKELAGEAVAQTMAPVKQHLGECRVCREEYEVLRDLARLEAEGHGPSNAEWSGST
jgi:predicted anti-sigma-YlaC factor YlaD